MYEAFLDQINRITELRAKYTEENRINESLKESSKLESLNDLTKNSIKILKKPILIFQK